MDITIATFTANCLPITTFSSVFFFNVRREGCGMRKGGGMRKSNMKFSQETSARCERQVPPQSVRGWAAYPWSFDVRPLCGHPTLLYRWSSLDRSGSGWASLGVYCHSAAGESARSSNTSRKRDTGSQSLKQIRQTLKSKANLHHTLRRKLQRKAK